VLGVIGSPGFPTDRATLRDQVARNVRRGHYPAGMTRQLVAVIASGDRRRLLRKISAPTLVIHGAADPLVPVEAGRDTARHIAGAKLQVIDGMGHDLPPGLQPILVEAIAAHCRDNERTV
jgi:pimeloyl-ACP methyl ester carboxylesterase